MRKAFIAETATVADAASGTLKPGVIINLFRIVRQLEYELVLVSENIEAEIKAPRNVLNIVQEQGIPVAYHIAMTDLSANLSLFNDGIYDLPHSVCLGTDERFSANCRTFKIRDMHPEQSAQPLWDQVFQSVRGLSRSVVHHRQTGETGIAIRLNPDGQGKGDMQTGLGFFDHMLDQIARHGAMDLSVHVTGDLHVDEHHTIEDTGLALGEAFLKVLGKKTGLERYGFFLPMDESVSRVTLDFSGRPFLVWKVGFTRDKVGEIPVELFEHFFKSFCDTAKCNLYVEAEGDNDHHKIEAVFKAFARSLRMALRKDPESTDIPSTKGTL